MQPKAASCQCALPPPAGPFTCANKRLTASSRNALPCHSPEPGPRPWPSLPLPRRPHAPMPLFPHPRVVHHHQQPLAGGLPAAQPQVPVAQAAGQLNLGVNEGPVGRGQGQRWGPLALTAGRGAGRASTVWGPTHRHVLQCAACRL